MTVHDSDAELEPDEEARCVALLQSAFAPREIDPARHELLISAALDDPFAPASPSERAESERLRQALDGVGTHRDLPLVEALATAYGTRVPPPGAQAGPRPAKETRPTGQLYYLRFAAVIGSVAAAAGLLLAVKELAVRDAAPSADLPSLALAQSRSSAPLFEVEAPGDSSTRIDRIAAVRGRELRANRYAAWGVR